MKNKIEFKAEGKKLDIAIHGDVSEYALDEGQTNEGGCNCVEALDKLLNENKDASMINISINSAGGSVFEGLAIYNMLKRHKAYKKVTIEGCACSIASVIAMCGNQVIMPESSIMMIHNAWCGAVGNAKEFRKLADSLDKINETIRKAYLSKFKGDEDKLIELMDNESYLTAQECYEYGLATRIGEDSEENDKLVDEVLDKHVRLFENKLSTLKEIQNTINMLDSDEKVEALDTESIEETVDDTVEVVEEVEKAEETETKDENVEVATADGETIETKEDVENDIKEVKENALKRFFNLTK